MDNIGREYMGGMRLQIGQGGERFLSGPWPLDLRVTIEYINACENQKRRQISPIITNYIFLNFFFYKYY